MNILTIDVGGTTTKFAVVDKKGNILKKYQAIDTKPGHDLKWLFNYINDLNINFDKMSICIPGFYNPSKKEVFLAGNLQYKNFKILKEIAKYTNKPITILNDANAAALGEFWKLSMVNPKIQNVLVYTIGTGIGGSAILNGQLYEGTDGFAGEFGHGGNFQNLIDCNCGNKNCLEPISSASGIIKAINDYALNNKDSILNSKLKTKGSALKLENIVDLVANGNKEIIEIIKNGLKPLAEHISIMIYALNPQVIIIGGGFSDFGKNIPGKSIDEIIKEYLKNNIPKFLFDKIEIRNAQHGNDAAFYGCAFKAFN